MDKHPTDLTPQKEVERRKTIGEYALEFIQLFGIIIALAGLFNLPGLFRNFNWMRFLVAGCTVLAGIALNSLGRWLSESAASRGQYRIFYDPVEQKEGRKHRNPEGFK